MAFFPTNFMLQASHEDDHHTPYFRSPILQPCNTTQDLHGVAAFLDKGSMSSYATDICDQETNNGEDEGSDDGLLGGERKKRLNMEQVKTLERNFALGNKLDPERKMQLAKALGLQPRQIAIWFQNRRARWKTKQLEKDYDVLKKQFEAIKAQNDSLVSQNHKLHVEIMALKNKEPTESFNLNIKETEGSCSNKSENSSEIKLNISRAPITDSAISSLHHHHHQPHPIANQIFHNSSLRPEYDDDDHHHHNHDNHLNALKVNQPVNINKDESLCNMFVGMEDQSAFWPWLEQQPQFN